MYPKLRVLRVMLYHDYTRGGLSLQTMLNGLQQLETLHLYLHGLETPNIDLSSSHPHLRAFLLSVHPINQPAIHFLKHHPTIEYLNLKRARGYILDDHDLPRLTTLHVDSSVEYTPALLSPGTQRCITHLHLQDLSHNIDFVYPLVRSVASTLRYLELGWKWVGGFHDCMTGFGPLLGQLPRLDEMRIMLSSRSVLEPIDLVSEHPLINLD